MVLFGLERGIYKFSTVHAVKITREKKRSQSEHQTPKGHMSFESYLLSRPHSDNEGMYKSAALKKPCVALISLA